MRTDTEGKGSTDEIALLYGMRGSKVLIGLLWSFGLVTDGDLRLVLRGSDFSGVLGILGVL